jgi:ectoine hydroxylase-related dioxygenase (phytanoyl-CoA dioxygenase family)
VPGSHYSGRNPPTQDNPQFEGKGPMPILCRAGDMYLHNGQTWHRGMPNLSNRTRYLFGPTYGQRFVAQRFYPFINYQLPRHVQEGADDRTKRLLGIHSKGAYG